MRLRNAVTYPCQPLPPILAQSASLTATVNSDKSVDLDLSNGPADWWFRINSWGTCTAVSGTSVNGIQGYQPGTHSVTAYSDNDCDTKLAETTFTIPAASLAVTVNGDRSVDLTLSNGPSPWYFRIDGGSCTTVNGTTVSGIKGYKPGFYSVGAFATAGCKDFLAVADFTIPDPPPPTATLTTTVNPGPSVNLALTNGPSNNNWWFRINWWGSCTAVTGTNTVNNIQGYKVGTHSVDAYSDSGCDTKIASSSFTIPALALDADVDRADWSLDLPHQPMRPHRLVVPHRLVGQVHRSHRNHRQRHPRLPVRFLHRRRLSGQRLRTRRPHRGGVLHHSHRHPDDHR